MPVLARLYGQLEGLPVEVLHAAMSEYSCRDLQDLVYAAQAPEAAVEAADIILASRMGNLPAATALVARQDLVDLLSEDMLQAVLKRQADVTLQAFSGLRGALEAVSRMARRLLETRGALTLDPMHPGAAMLPFGPPAG